MGSQRVGYDQTISFQKTALKYENHYVSIGSKLEPSVTPGMVFQLIHAESWRLDGQSFSSQKAEPEGGEYPRPWRCTRKTLASPSPRPEGRIFMN